MSFLTRTMALAAITALALGNSRAVGSPETGAAQVNVPLQFTMKDIEGKPVDLASYKGKVLLLVNTASKCGLTPQYKPLQALYAKYREKGFAIIGFPANNFGQQEPGSDTEIKQFCSANYEVTFPLFSKVSVKGDDICPLYSYLTSEKTNPGFAGEIPWNFTKFLVGRDGRIVARFEPKTTPDNDDVVAAIERELAKK
ncbi:MAG TPA: glutathione peroxidase [Candidatus Glassbacteria bacterium]|nr:glutathione peroxidase [Candidatus Glassbacteria bacterium]